MTKKVITWVLVFLSVTLTMKTAIHVVTTFAPDFSVFYQSAQNLLNGKNLYTDAHLYTGLGYPPLTILFFLPFVLLSYYYAQALWIVLTIIAGVACVYLTVNLCIKKRSFIHYLAVYTIFILSFPTRFTIGMGQINIVVLFLFLLFARFALEKKLVLGGLILGILITLKPHFMLLLPLYMCVRLWKSIFLSFVAVSFLVFLFGILFGWPLFATYFSHTLPPLLPFVGRGIYYNQSLSGMFSRILAYPYSYGMTLIVSGVLYVVTIWVAMQNKYSLKSILMISIPLLVLIEPLAWQHHFVFLHPTAVWVWNSFVEMRSRTLQWIMICAIGLISINIKNPGVFSAYWVGNLMLSHVTIGTLILYILSLHSIIRQEKLIYV